MYDVFDLSQKNWTFTARASAYLRNTVDATAATNFADNLPALPVMQAAWWGEQTKALIGAGGSGAGDLFNRIIWKGFKGDQPYPARSNKD